ncbi:MAG: sugar transferase [Proteobacteria bacterium]|nr:sugar transferase [Pseudomonadota bacterium]MBU1710335.1 sugar transferase [Pseudomonadota bacterium]
MVLLKLSDFFLFFIAIYLSNTLHANELIPLESITDIAINIETIIYFGIFLYLGDWLRDFYGFYASRRLDSFFREILDVLKMSSSLVICVAPGYFIFDTPYGSPLFLAYFWLILNCLTILFRFALRILLNYMRLRGRNLRKVLVVGTNKIAYDWADKIKKQKELGMQVLGFVDDRLVIHPQQVNYLGTISQLPLILRENVIDEVVIALPIRSKFDAIQRAILYAEEQGVLVRYAYPLFDSHKHSLSGQSHFSLHDSRVGNLLYDSPMQSWQYVIKRLLDIVLATAIFLLISPLLITVAVLIKATSKGPIFFLQQRVGLNKRIFTCYKFRTMFIGAENLQAELETQNEMDGAAFKMKNDPRVTRIGNFLRKSSIDELPQLINVIKGDISLVGPRPLPLRDYKLFSQYCYCRRQSVLPGITCTWQVSGRNKINFEEWMKLDLEYIDNWSLFNDLKILLLTLPAVIKRTGAY